MKNKKLNLNELKVKSFVTDLEKSSANTAKGGLETWAPCITQPIQGVGCTDELDRDASLFICD